MGRREVAREWVVTCGRRLESEGRATEGIFMTGWC